MIGVFALIWLSRFIRPSVFSAQVIKCHANCEIPLGERRKGEKNGESRFLAVWASVRKPPFIYKNFVKQNFVNDIPKHFSDIIVKRATSCKG